MKKIMYISALLTGLGLAGCKDSFLDQKPYDSVSVNTAIVTESDMGNAVNGMYAGVRSSNLYGRSIPFIGDVLADNVYISTANSGRYITQNNYSFNSQDGYFTDTWTQAYTVILRANNVINASVPVTDASKQYQGEALTMRAILYFDLIRLYATPYAKEASAPGVPLILKYDPYLKPGRNTVAEVYDQIIKDLNQGFDLMTSTTKTSSYITKYVAKSILSKVYLYKGDYANAQATALEVVGKGGYTLTDSSGYVAYWTNAAPRADKVETIFEISADNVNNAGSDALANMYSQTGYGDGLASTDLYNLYSAQDVRKKLITPGRRSGNDALIVAKYPNIANTNDKDDFKVIRYADVLLILAESYYRNGNEASARTYLNTVAQKRQPSLTASTATGAALLEAIITERRKELAFEGDRFNDLNRLGRDITRNTQYPTQARMIAFSNFRRIAPIPQVELDANPSIRQNSEY